MDLHKIGLSKRSRLLPALLCTLCERAMISSFKEKETALIDKSKHRTQASVLSLSLCISCESLTVKNNNISNIVLVPEPNKVVLVSLHCLCRSGPSLESHICCFRNPVCLHTTTSCLIAALHSALLHSQRVMKLSLNSFIYYFSALPVADEPKQTVSRCALAAAPT